jgi:hypothetical protein
MGYFSHFPTRSLAHEEFENCDDMQTMSLTSNTSQWDPYNEVFTENKDRFLNFRGDLVKHQAKQRKILGDAGVF